MGFAVREGLPTIRRRRAVNDEQMTATYREDIFRRLVKSDAALQVREPGVAAHRVKERVHFDPL